MLITLVPDRHASWAAAGLGDLLIHRYEVSESINLRLYS